MGKGEILTLTIAEGIEVTEGVDGTVFAEINDTTNWEGTNLVQAYDVSAYVEDARSVQWMFIRDSDGMQLNYEITRTETTVTVTTEVPPVSGNYTLLGVGIG